MMKVFSLLETLEIMITEASNELTRLKVTERIMQRASLRGKTNTQMLATTQAKISMIEHTIADLKDIHSFEVDEEKRKVDNRPKEKTV